MQKKQVIYISLITLLFSLIFPFLAIAPIVFFILSKNSVVNWTIFILIFAASLFLIYAIGWFNSSISFSATVLNYLYNIVQFLFLPFIFAFVYYFFIVIYKKVNSSILTFILISAIPFAVLIVFSLYFLKSRGFSFVQFAPAFEQIFGNSYSEKNLEKIFINIIEKEIPKSVSVISIGLALLVEQQLVGFTKKNPELTNIIKPLDSIRLGKIFSWITIIAIYSLLILKFILKINIFLVELILFNIFYLLTTLHFINGLGVIIYFYKNKVKQFMENRILYQLKSRPLMFFLTILAIFVIILFLIPYFIYIYFAIALLSAIDTIYPIRKEKS